MSAPDDRLLMDRYLVCERLGGGCFGTVYRAEQMAFGTRLRDVALKISKDPMGDAQARETFADALLLSRLSDECHDPLVAQGLVTIHDAGIVPAGDRYEGHAYCVMELVRGGGLHRRLDGRAISLKQALHYMRQILTTLAFMHRGGQTDTGQRPPILHRDLKPSNVLLASPAPDAGQLEVAKVTDFGLAVEIDPLLGWTEAAGDVCYQAPECFSELRSSPQGDVYSLGLIFHEMVTGVHPFAEVAVALDAENEAERERARRARLEARRRATFSELGRAAELRDAPQLRAVIRRMLQFEELDRYADAGAALNALQQALEAEGRGPAPELSSAVSDPSRVQNLVARARALLEAGDESAAWELAGRAMQINGDPARVPDRQVVGSAYLLATQILLDRGEVPRARRLSQEGYQRRICRETCEAMALCYEYLGASPAARQAWAESRRYAPERTEGE
jgi:serine/threonine protein kinase